jgi:pimeloyl-ACP methyl ester carboxylesterase
LTTISNGSPELRRKILASIQRTDVRFRGALGASMATLTSPQEFTRLDTSGLPSAAFAGGDEHYLSGDYLDALTWKGLWRGRVQRLPGAGHLVLAEQPEELGRLAVEAMEAWGA